MSVLRLGVTCVASSSIVSLSDVVRRLVALKGRLCVGVSHEEALLSRSSDSSSATGNAISG